MARAAPQRSRWRKLRPLVCAARSWMRLPALRPLARLERERGKLHRPAHRKGAGHSVMPSGNRPLTRGNSRPRKCRCKPRSKQDRRRHIRKPSRLVRDSLRLNRVLSSVRPRESGDPARETHARKPRCPPSRERRDRFNRSRSDASSDTPRRSSPRRRRVRRLPSACRERAGGRNQAPRPSRPACRCRCDGRDLPATACRCGRDP